MSVHCPSLHPLKSDFLPPPGGLYWAFRQLMVFYRPLQHVVLSLYAVKQLGSSWYDLHFLIFEMLCLLLVKSHILLVPAVGQQLHSLPPLLAIPPPEFRLRVHVRQSPGVEPTHPHGIPSFGDQSSRPAFQAAVSLTCISLATAFPRAASHEAWEPEFLPGTAGSVPD